MWVLNTVGVLTRERGREIWDSGLRPREYAGRDQGDGATGRGTLHLCCLSPHTSSPGSCVTAAPGSERGCNPDEVSGAEGTLLALRRGEEETHCLASPAPSRPAGAVRSRPRGEGPRHPDGSLRLGRGNRCGPYRKGPCWMWCVKGCQGPSVCHLARPASPAWQRL